MDGKVEMLRDYFASKGVSQERVAEMTGTHKTYVNQLLVGKKAFGKKTAQKWSDLFGLSYTWLLTGEGPMLKDGDGQAENAQPDGGIPYYDDVEYMQNGLPSGFSEGIVSGAHTGVMVIPQLPSREGDFIVRTRGMSMVDAQHPERSIPDGSLVCLRPLRTGVIEWGETYAVSTRDGYVVKRVMPGIDKEHIKCVPNNPDFAPYELSLPDDVTGMARVIGVISIRVM